MRRRLKSWSRPVTRNTVSMLAATTCSSVVSPATLRENRLRRGRRASMAPSSAAPDPGETATQSPTAGKRSRRSARWRSRPRTRARISPSAVLTR